MPRFSYISHGRQLHITWLLFRGVHGHVCVRVAGVAVGWRSGCWTAGADPRAWRGRNIRGGIPCAYCFLASLQGFVLVHNSVKWFACVPRLLLVYMYMRNTCTCTVMSTVACPCWPGSPAIDAGRRPDLCGSWRGHARPIQRNRLRLVAPSGSKSKLVSTKARAPATRSRHPFAASIQLSVIRQQPPPAHQTFAIASSRDASLTQTGPQRLQSQLATRVSSSNIMGLIAAKYLGHSRCLAHLLSSHTHVFRVSLDLALASLPSLKY